jgi:hypothetical protein
MLRNRLYAGLLALFALTTISVAPVGAASMSDYLENRVIDWMIRGQTYTPPTTLYLALATSTGSDAACGTEVTGGSYARASIVSSMTNWAGTQSSASTTASSGTGGTTSNNITVTFATPTATWGTVAELCVFDAPTAGNMMWRNGLTVSKTINTGDVVDFPAASLTFQIDN